MHDFDPHAHLCAKLAHVRFASTPVTASEWCQRMQDLRDIKPRPVAKLYGAQGPSPAQAEQHRQAMRVWNSLYRKATKEQKRTLALSNAAYEARQKGPA